MRKRLTNTLKKGTTDIVGAQEYKVLVSKKAKKQLDKLPRKILYKFIVLAEQLRDKGPIATNWKNYSKLEKDHYHCPLDYSYVACWSNEQKTIIIEVYYVGSRENAPY